MPRLRKSLLALAAVVTVAACATVGSFDQQLADGYRSYTAVRETAATSIELGEVSIADAEKVDVLLKEARALLDAAQALRGTDPATAQGKLQLATSLLLQVQRYTRPVPKGTSP